MKNLLSKLSVSAQIFSGFGAIIAVAVIAGGIAIFGMSSFERNFDKFDEIVEDSLLASELNADMAKALLNANRYISTRSDEDLAATREFISQVEDGVAAAVHQIQAPYRAERIALIKQNIASFADGLDSVVKLYAERDELVGNRLDVIGPKVRQGLTSIATTAARDGDYETAYAAAEMQEHLLLGRLFVKSFLLTNDQKDIEHAATELAAAERSSEALERSIQNPARLATLAEIGPLFDQYVQASNRLGVVIAERNATRDAALINNGLATTKAAAEIKDSAIKDEKKIAAATRAEVSLTSYITMGVNVAGVVLAIALAWIIGRGVSTPIVSMTGAMQRLADGDLEAEIPAQDRKDEIGRMAAAVQVFKDNALERVRLQSESEREQEARAMRQRKVDELIAGFRTHSQDILQSVGSNMSQMQDTARSLGDIAENSAKRAGDTAASSEQASTNVQTVAAAAEELAASIGEISSKVADTTTIVGQATEGARSSNEKVASLDAAAQKIGDVVSLIKDIAEQTNLLALNATIEAARAGDAGKGFAVVASEVKTLAEQTAKATEEIATQIGAIQGATKDAVESITQIARTMEEVDQYTGMIAAAVEEQGSATSEISRNVQEAADGTRYVAENMAAMSTAATETNRSADNAQTASSTAAAQTEELRSTIDTFLKNVAAA